MKNTSPSSLGQLLLIGTPSELDKEFCQLVKTVQPGGFILFTRNMRAPQQLRNFIDELRSLCDHEPLITIDQEGGRVSRLRAIGNEPPSGQQLREKGDPKLIEWHGRLTGQLLRLFGFNMDLCPLLDIAFEEDADNSLRGRCYGTTPEEVIEKAALFNDNLRSTGVMSCGKHFPGYSCATGDPHLDLSSLPRPLSELEANELNVFRHFIPSVDSMMIGHISFAELDDSGNPASLSQTVIKDLLRKKMGFEGLIMTDDLDMGAILNHYGFAETMQMGLEAGNDMLMICHRPQLAHDAIKALQECPTSEIDRALSNIERCRKRFVPPDDFSEQAFQKLDQEVWELRVATLGKEKAQERSLEDGNRSPVEMYSLGAAKKTSKISTEIY